MSLSLTPDVYLTIFFLFFPPLVHHDDLLQTDVMVRTAESHKIIVSVQG